MMMKRMTIMIVGKTAIDINSKKVFKCNSESNFIKEKLNLNLEKILNIAKI